MVIRDGWVNGCLQSTDLGREALPLQEAHAGALWRALDFGADWSNVVGLGRQLFIESAIVGLTIRSIDRSTSRHAIAIIITSIPVPCVLSLLLGHWQPLLPRLRTILTASKTRQRGSGPCRFPRSRRRPPSSSSCSSYFGKQDGVDRIRSGGWGAVQCRRSIRNSTGSKPEASKKQPSPTLIHTHWRASRHSALLPYSACAPPRCQQH